MSRGAAGALAAAALGGCLAGGCTVGSGSGSVDGFLFQYNCIHAPGNQLDAPTEYHMNASFFAGVPIEDLSVNGMHTNEMHIRIQNNGLAIQYSDALYFDILSSYEVARCVRGAVDKNTGLPLYNVTEALPDGGSTLWCDWSGMAFSTDGGSVDAGAVTPGGPDAGASLDGGLSMTAPWPRIHVTPYTDVRASFAALSTCGVAKVTGVASDGYIAFQYFGGASQSNRPPTERDPISTDFVIQFGDRMRASFDIRLIDQVLIAAKQENEAPPRDPEIGGTLHGYFDFELERGRSAQPFP
ncbi:MAG TPA: hypothetical protein VHO67_14375 [Polyangia bacterium]|nr:hypothetical protein [Polyangia bacterium]